MRSFLRVRTATQLFLNCSAPRDSGKEVLALTCSWNSTREACGPESTFQRSASSKGCISVGSLLYEVYSAWSSQIRVCLPDTGATQSSHQTKVKVHFAHVSDHLTSGACSVLDTRPHRLLIWISGGQVLAPPKKAGGENDVASPASREGVLL